MLLKIRLRSATELNFKKPSFSKIVTVMSQYKKIKFNLKRGYWVELHFKLELWFPQLRVFGFSLIISVLEVFYRLFKGLLSKVKFGRELIMIVL